MWSTYSGQGDGSEKGPVATTDDDSDDYNDDGILKYQRDDGKGIRVGRDSILVLGSASFYLDSHRHQWLYLHFTEEKQALRYSALLRVLWTGLGARPCFLFSCHI